MDEQPEKQEDRRKDLSQEEVGPQKKIKSSRTELIQQSSRNFLEDLNFPSFSFHSADQRLGGQTQELNKISLEQGPGKTVSSAFPSSFRDTPSFKVSDRREFEEEKDIMNQDLGQDLKKQERPVFGSLFGPFQEIRSQFVDPMIRLSEQGQEGIRDNIHEHRSGFMQNPMAFMSENLHKFEQCQDHANLNPVREINEQKIKNGPIENLSGLDVQYLMGLLEKSSQKLNQQHQENVLNVEENKSESIETAIYGLFANSKILKKMGEGSHGTVIKIQNEDGKIRVIKLFPKTAESEFFRENRILSMLEEAHFKERHAFERYGTRVFQSKEYHGIIFEAGIASLKDFKKFLQAEKKELGEMELLCLFFALWHAVKYLLKSGVCHRDIKLDNIVLHGRNLELELIDFSLSLPINEKEKILGWAGTITYLDPHLVDNFEEKIPSSYEEIVEGDLYSIGILILEFSNSNFQPRSQPGHKSRPQKLKKEILDCLKKKQPTIAEILEILLFGEKKREALEVFMNKLSQSDVEIGQIILNHLYSKEAPKFKSGLSKYSAQFKEFLGIGKDEENLSEQSLYTNSDVGLDEDFEIMEEIERLKLLAIQNPKSRITCYENALKLLIKSRDFKQGQEFSEIILKEVLQDESIDLHPLLFSTLGIQLSMEGKGESAFEVFSKGFQFAKKNKDRSILLNNYECLAFQKMTPQNGIEYFREAFRLSNNNQDGRNNGRLVTKKWLRFSWNNRSSLYYNSLRVPEEENAKRDEDEKRNDELILSFHDLSQKEYPFEEEKYKLNTIIFFNLAYKMAFQFYNFLNNQSQKYVDLSKRINNFSFYFNHKKSRELNKTVKFEGNIEFFIKILDLILLFKDRPKSEIDIGEDSHILKLLVDQSNLIYLFIDDFYSLLRSEYTEKVHEVMLELCPDLLFIFIGLPLVFKSRKMLNQKWKKSFFLLEKINILSKVTNTFRIEFNPDPDQYPLDSDFGENKSDFSFDFENNGFKSPSALEKNEFELPPAIERNEPEECESLLKSASDFRTILKRNPLIDILGTREITEFEITTLKSPFFILPKSYKYKGIFGDFMEPAIWSIEGIDILVSDILHVLNFGEDEDLKVQEWFDENKSKMKSIKDLEMVFLLENSSEKPFHLLKNIDVLDLLKLKLQISFNRGESSYPIDIIANFIKYQKEIEELTLYNSNVSLKKEEIALLKDAIKDHQKLTKVFVSFYNYSKINEQEVLSLAQSIAELPSLKNVTIHLENCGNILDDFQKELQNLFAKLGQIIIDIHVTHKI